MLTTVSSTDLVRACQVLFSPDISFSLAFVQNLDPSTLKTAYRKKALETHPDRAQALGVHEQIQSKRFREVKKAYEVLLPVTEKTVPLPSSHHQRVRPQARHHEPPKEKPRYTSPNKMSSFYRGCVPNHSLRLGQFLYYSGIITWRHLIDAISWQRRVKPRYGQIALEWNILDRQQIMDILTQKERSERFGEYARRTGIISDFQHLAIIGKQNKCHRMFGEYFILNGILTQRQLDILLIRLIQHNETNRY